jgi:ABC-2 type transport system permease protein
MAAELFLLFAIGRRSFRRYATYRVATFAGLFTNAVFGAFIAYTYIALWRQRPHIGGYDQVDAVTYVWIAQALIMPVATWGGGFQTDFSERIRTGDIAVDLYRPTGLVPWWLAVDLGRATFHLFGRGVPTLIVGLVMFDLRLPADLAHWLLVLASIYLAVLVSFGIRFLVSLSAFWLLDSQGIEQIATILGIFCSGMVLPLVAFPGVWREILLHAPWAALIQVPADIWLGHRTGADLMGGLLFQAAWAIVLLGLGGLVLRLAERKVVVQGG